MKRTIYQAVAMILVLTASIYPAFARVAEQVQPSAEASGRDATAEIISLLNRFLAGVDDPAVHERFWANDLVYVGSAGTLRTKSEILASVRTEAGQNGSNAGLNEKFTAEDVAVRRYGDIAVLNFTLVAHGVDVIGSKTIKRTRRYRNSGVFRLSSDGWQAINWQATAIIEPPKD